MRGSRAVRVGLSGTSLALAALAVGCSTGGTEVATKELVPAAHHVESGVGEALIEREREEARYQRQRRDREVLAEAPITNDANDPASPWFLRPAGARNADGDTNSRPVALQPTGGDQPPIVIHEPPKPRPVATPNPPPRPGGRDGWRIRAACGRG
jgi:hypothetical protein